MAAVVVMMVWRPRPLYWVTFVFVLGVPTALLAAIGLEGVLVEGQRFGFVLLLLAAAGAFGLIRLARTRLALSETSVSAADIIFRGSCRREDLASIRESGRVLLFIRRDGSTALQTDARAWSRTAIDEVAAKLSVPVECSRPLWVTRYACPACGYPGLQEPPERKGVASHEICPSCGFEFGETDGVEGKTYAQWRQQWIDSGMPWWAKQTGQDPPLGWNAAAQLKAVAQ